MQRPQACISTSRAFWAMSWPWALAQAETRCFIDWVLEHCAVAMIQVPKPLIQTKDSGGIIGKQIQYFVLYIRRKSPCTFLCQRLGPRQPRFDPLFETAFFIYSAFPESVCGCGGLI